MTRARPIVLLDVDDVCAQFVTAVVAACERTFGRQFERPRTWDMRASMGISDADWHLIDAQISAPGFCRGLQEIPGAAAGIEALRSIVDVYCVTAPWPSPTWAFERAEWCRTVLGVDGNHLVQTRAKHLVRGSVLVDDKLETLVSWGAVSKTRQPVLFEATHNLDADWPGWRVCYWPELVELLRDILVR